MEILVNLLKGFFIFGPFTLGWIIVVWVVILFIQGKKVSYRIIKK